MKIHFWTLKGRRKTNQDAHTIFNNINGNDKSKNDIIILGCYDGHGEEGLGALTSPSTLAHGAPCLPRTQGSRCACIPR